MGNRRRGKNTWYCLKCLRKYRKRTVPTDRNCCGEPLRHNTARIAAQVVTRLKRKRGIRKSPLKSAYQKYLASKTWRNIRARVIERDSGKCVACGRTAECVHHKSYDAETMEGNNDSNLVSLCRDCHKSIEFTKVDGKRRKNGLRRANEKLDEAIRRKCQASVI